MIYFLTIAIAIFSLGFVIRYILPPKKIQGIFLLELCIAIPVLMYLFSKIMPLLSLYLGASNSHSNYRVQYIISYCTLNRAQATHEPVFFKFSDNYMAKIVGENRSGKIGGKKDFVIFIYHNGKEICKMDMDGDKLVDR